MKEEDTADLAHFFSELQRETDRGLPLVAAALIDEKLLDALQSFLCLGKASERLLSGSNAPLGTFSARIEACFALGLIDEFEYQEISLVRKIRNVFAHSKHGLSFSNDKVLGLCTNFKSNLPQGSDYPVNEARFRFINATVCLVLRLYYRDAWVAQERRQPKVWVAPDQSRWRSTAEEKPPAGVPIVAMAKQGPKGVA
ncbi:MAG: transcriptional regulator [Pseudomonadota bacterium]|nr:transcriptional regulator [Pseudomonadota bacterium]